MPDFDTSVFAWFYVDSLSLYPARTTRSNALVCRNDSVRLQSALAGLSYEWNDGTQTPVKYAKDTGWYSCYAYTNDSVFMDSIYVQELNSGVKGVGLTDTTLCRGAVLTLTSPAAASTSTYQWSTGALSASVNVSDSALLWVKTTLDGGCARVDTFRVQVQEKAMLSLPTDTGFCGSGHVQLDAFHSSYTRYLWNTTDTSSSIVASSPGLYKVTASNAVCSTSDSVQVSSWSYPVVTLPPDTVLCFEETGPLLLSTAVGYASYQWEPVLSTASFVQATQPALYKLRVSDAHGCTSSDSMLVLEDCALRIFIPNAFTPNGDGINEVFRVRGAHVRKMNLKIYSRSNQELFSSDDMAAGWDGTFENAPCQDGVYIYILRYTDKGEEQVMKGNFTLMR